jgi:hypothetical protein
MGLAALLLGSSGCASRVSNATQLPEVAAGPSLAIALARSACPYRVIEASGRTHWEHGADESRLALLISVRLGDADDTIVLVKGESGDPRRLVLDMRDAPIAPIPGSAIYREHLGTASYEQVVLRCKGGEVYRITDIVGPK